MQRLRIAKIYNRIGVLIADSILVATQRTFVVEDAIALRLIECHVCTHLLIFAGYLAVELLVLLCCGIILSDSVSLVGLLDAFRQTTRAQP